MSVITIEGRAGAGAPDVGKLVARELDIDFVDVVRTVVADVAHAVVVRVRLVRVGGRGTIVDVAAHPVTVAVVIGILRTGVFDQ